MILNFIPLAHPGIPDKQVAKMTKGQKFFEAAIPRFAHLNRVINYLNEYIIPELNALGASGYQGALNAGVNIPVGLKNYSWKFATAGQAGIDGPLVEAGDELFSISDSPVAGPWSTVGSNFIILQANTIITGHNADPTVNSDDANGFKKGALWFNTTTLYLFVATDVTTGAAVWARIGGNLPTHVVRTNNPIVDANPINNNISALDKAIGVTPTPQVRTSGTVVAANSVNLNINALDSAIGLDASMTSQAYINTGMSIYMNLSALDLALSNAISFNMLSASINGAGTNQAPATAIASGIAVVGAADGTVGVVLPAVAVGKSVTIYNILAAQNLKLYPAAGEYINAGAINVGVKFSHATDVSSVICTRASALHWTVTAIHGTIS